MIAFERHRYGGRWGDNLRSRGYWRRRIWQARQRRLGRRNDIGLDRNRPGRRTRNAEPLVGLVDKRCSHFGGHLPVDNAGRPELHESGLRREFFPYVIQADDGARVTVHIVVGDALHLETEFQVSQVPVLEFDGPAPHVLGVVFEIEERHVLPVVLEAVRHHGRAVDQDKAAPVLSVRLDAAHQLVVTQLEKIAKLHQVVHTQHVVCARQVRPSVEQMFPVVPVDVVQQFGLGTGERTLVHRRALEDFIVQPIEISV